MIDVDGSGNPLLLSDRVLTIKGFDAAGPYHTGNRATSGSNNYENSNLRQWLNSSSPNSGGNTINWIQNDPGGSGLWLYFIDNMNQYNTEKGFLADGNFTSSERGLIQPVTHNVMLDDADEAGKSGGAGTHSYNATLANIVQNYNTADYKEVTDSVLLLSVKQLKEFVGDRSAE